MAEEVLNDIDDDASSNNDLDLYQIQAEELEEEDWDIEAEMKKLALQFFPDENEEEEKKEEAHNEDELRFWERARKIQDLAAQFTPSTLSGDHRDANAGYYGGFACQDKALMSKQRSAATEIVKMVGKKLFSGSTDLTRISFPIKCMCPTSMLELMPTLQSTMNIFLNKAAMETDPVERMKLVMTHNLSFFYKEKIFEKPLNPILGETY